MYDTNIYMYMYAGMGSSTLVLVLKSALSTFFEVLEGAFKHLIIKTKLLVLKHFLSKCLLSTFSSIKHFIPVERLFSIAGKVFRPDRCRLTDHTFEILMFIRCNNKLMC